MIDRTDARLHVRRLSARRREFVESGRCGDRRVDEAFLQRSVAREAASGDGAQNCATRDVQEEALAIALLLGGIRAPGRMEIIQNAEVRVAPRRWLLSR